MSITVQNLTKRFGSFTALDDVSLELPSGELTALLGPSGSGKTTLLRIIAGMELPDRGQVLFSGQDATHVSPAERGVGFVFQHYALFRHMSIFDNVAFGLTVKKGRERPGRAEVAEKVHRLLKMVQLDWCADRYPHQLSGGQRQRIALARALAVEPKVLLLDEPFGALDTKVRTELRRWLRRLHDEMHITSVFVTHDQEEAMEIADRIAVMGGGRLQQVGRPGELYAEPRTEFVAGFVGLMNLRPVAVARGRADWLGTALPTRLADGPATAGVRPEDLVIVAAGGVPVRVERVIDFGSARRVTLIAADGTSLRLQTTGGHDLAPGAALRVVPRRIVLYRDGMLADTLVPDAADIAA
jgi:sulfate transport system ATP-binding protein